MILKKYRSIIKKGIAIFLLINLFNQVMLPTIALALTSGPTVPEATSFEPIDTTEMINPLTGDFTYNLPLLEIPGPEGGYPLSLSYHAGIQPNEEASWAGLGWGINPGAISRNVNGYPDDFVGVQSTARSYWGGGSTKSIGVNVSLGLQAASVSFGLDFSQDTYKGFGVGGSMGVNFGLWNQQGVTGGVTLGVSPYGDPYVGANIGISTAKAVGGGFTGSTGVSVMTNFQDVNVGANAGVSYATGGARGSNVSLLGASISSTEGKVSLTAGGGGMSVNNANAGRISSESSGWSISIPMPIISLGISYNYRRYWSDESSNTSTYGVLSPAYPITLNYSANDTYRLLDPINENIIDNPDPDKLVGGTYPNYDDYSVTAQGLSGSIRPYDFQNTLYTQNRINNQDHSNDITAISINSNRSSGRKLQYRFINDFSNRYTQNPSNFSEDFVYDTSIYGNDDDNYGYNPSYNRLAGSKHINYYYNGQMSNSISGAIETNSKGFVRRSDLQSQIGSFVITNASGVTYHYALPAYSFDEYTETRKIGGVTSYNSLSKPTPYAYTWYLTAITGPDYVDRNENNQVDEADWGYWVEFNYGKWNDDYAWRNPAEGFHKDIDNTFNSYSRGKKEVYYLDYVKTRTHTAFFVKDLRNDGKSDASYGVCAALKLDHILLVQNHDLTTEVDDIRKASSKLNYPYQALMKINNHGFNVIDVDDFKSIEEDVVSKCIRKIQFNYDYSLSSGVPNSYVGSFLESYGAQTNEKTGKLTLLSVDFQGKSGIPVTPPIEFEYDLHPDDISNQENVKVISTSTSNRKGDIEVQSSNKLIVGDIIKFTINGTLYYCTLILDKGDKIFEVLYLKDKPPTITVFIPAVKTKNPPYNKDFYDIWHLYKSDYQGTSNNDNITRITTDISNRSTDVWSLRRIKSSIGNEINIDYEGDTYSQSVLNKNRSLTVNNFNYLGGTASSGYQARVNISGNEQPLNKIFKVGDKIDLVALAKFDYHQPPFPKIDNEYNVIESSKHLKPSRILEIVGDEMKFSLSDEMKAAVTETRTKTHVHSIVSATADIITGNLKVSGVSRFYGGGIRVASITVDNLNGVKKQTRYNYSRPGLSANDDGGSSGVTSYEPISLEESLPTLDDEAKKAYNRALYKDMDYLLSIAREAPSPGVMYEYVSIQDFDILPEVSEPIKNTGSIQYQYEVFNKNMLGIKQYQYAKSANRERKNLSIKDFTSRIGNVKRMITYDDKGNKLTEQINHYLHDQMSDKSFDYQSQHYANLLSLFNYQGTIQERYSDARMVKVDNNPIDKRVMSGRDVYPAILTGSTSIDYKNGIRVEQKNLSFDFYSGAVTKSLNFDSYGNRFITEITPAYRQYPALGLKLDYVFNPSNGPKHMLTQTASTYIYAVDGFNAPLGIVSARVQTWGNDIPVLDPEGNPTSYNQNNIWREKAKYVWSPTGISLNGLTSANSFVDFFAAAQNNPAWKKSSEVIKYNVFSAPLEATDINGNYAASKMGYANSKVIMSGNARYYEIAYSGTEDGVLSSDKLGTVSSGSGVITKEIAHTGEKSLKVAGINNGFRYSVSLNSLDPIRRDYLVAVWVKPTSNNISDAKLYYSIDGAEIDITPAYTKTAAGWYLIQMKVPAAALNGGNLLVGCKNVGSGVLYFDDFRFQPLNSSTVAYVYDSHSGELTYMLDNNNLYIHYQYDQGGRLIKTFKEILGKSQVPLVKETIYNYGKGPKWVNTGQTRCQSKMNNGITIFTGLIEAQQMDRSNVSTTFNQVRWVVVPGVATCVSESVDAYWFPTGKTRCHQFEYGGEMVTSGKLEVEKKDFNVSSPTYNQQKWEITSTSSECAATVFVKLITDDTQADRAYHVKIFDDPYNNVEKPAGYTVKVNYKLTSTNYTNNGISAANEFYYNMFVSTLDGSLGTWTYREGDSFYWTIQEVFLMPGFGYRIIP
ncbi:hypothetical protein LPB86_03830 [Pedobacter sp. MC2016-14]|uniref:hypothetical protein n=1 Tax=Pedobacter sp. MC2016-14 TaxID=2897327 RepID=UPI001E64BBBD|nr:hypothetical protein [Pedobacter sp. MC2016-14]MCD0487344.1 hypothetical protein [Pedobacter sp. MC2016-14]